MSRSEVNNTGNIGIQKSGVVIQSMHLGFGPEGNPVYKPVSNGIGSESTKKKRGRPRKYGPEGPIQVPAHVTLSLPSPPPPQPPSGTFISQPQPPPQAQQQMQAHSQPPQPQPHQNYETQPQQQAQPPQQPHHQQQHQHHQLQSGSSSPSIKKARGRPPGSGKKHHLDSLGAPGIGFTPHVITVNAGEDVASRIMSFSQTGPRAICILSANGAISNVTLRQAATSGGSVTYEGRFEILSLSGSFMLSDSGGQRSRSGGLSVSLAGPDGRVLGGGIAGLLTAASPVQVVVGSFIAESQRETKVGNPTESVFAPTKPYVANVQTGPSSPTSRGTLSGSSGGGGSPLHQSTGAVNSTPLGISNLPWK